MYRILLISIHSWIFSSMGTYLKLCPLQIFSKYAMLSRFMIHQHSYDQAQLDYIVAKRNKSKSHALVHRERNSDLWKTGASQRPDLRISISSNSARRKSNSSSSVSTSALNSCVHRNQSIKNPFDDENQVSRPGSSSTVRSNSISSQVFNQEQLRILLVIAIECRGIVLDPHLQRGHLYRHAGPVPEFFDIFN